MQTDTIIFDFGDVLVRDTTKFTYKLNQVDKLARFSGLIINTFVFKY